MPAYKLIYFDLKGKGETIRLTFAAAGIEFEDKRVNPKDWPELKPKIFTEQLPVLEIDGQTLTESTAIARYVAREGGLLGANSLESAKVESIADAIDLFLNTLAQYKYTPEGPLKEELHKSLKEKKFPDLIKLLELFLGDKEFFVTGKLSLAELHFYSVFSNIKECMGVSWEDKSSKLAELYKRVEKDPKIKAYLSKSK